MASNNISSLFFLSMFNACVAFPIVLWNLSGGPKRIVFLCVISCKDGHTVVW